MILSTERMENLIRMETRKEVNARCAKAWLEDIGVNEDWQDKIRFSRFNTIVRTAKNTKKWKGLLTVEELENCKSSKLEEGCLYLSSETTYAALTRIARNNVGAKLSALNFASFFNPGGGFIKGSISQEESLCHGSGLWPVLDNCSAYARRRRDTQVPPTYYSEVIYSKSVPFASSLYDADGGIYDVDVISCSAPNINRCGENIKNYDKALTERITAIYLLPYLNGCDTLVLGAWGCGVFKNDPKIIAGKFREIMKKYPRMYKEVVFAIPNDNVRAVFRETFNGI